jgi:hypothetical protein
MKLRNSWGPMQRIPGYLRGQVERKKKKMERSREAQLSVKLASSHGPLEGSQLLSPEE